MRLAATLTAIIALATAAAAQGEAPAADPVTVEVATLRVNIAGRQRMLSQRMTKAACLGAVLGDATYADQRNAAYELFGHSDLALREGSEDLGLPAERYNVVLGALREIDAEWAAYRRALASIEEVDAPSMALLDLDAMSLELLRDMNAAVNTTARAYGSAGPQLPLALTITVDVAGRQRMLTQKAVKEACLMRVASDPQVQAQSLATTMSIFEASLAALQQGFPDAGVLPEPNEAIADQLALVAELYTPMQDLLLRARGGEVLSDTDLAELSALSEPVLIEMNRAVGMYEDVDPAVVLGLLN
ncbi:type IV pili methyl-accepting chemotaxis transducer N-terminal domain-containing protein [Roseobacter sp. HKCCA0434]|uniref:type IV pili methyl-accepting chemotaxis transducer N-terminal domain-containing protein n=1 Tax=Roseobacter sp. HKCCA0434 TaxID=3079297 RepID=UPI00290597FF|nr:type IV pili methyl-accepting chemotaxis transducer N-terminal domain-containing protein [Roseobacter sp. HKCCA0434]